MNQLRQAEALIGRRSWNEAERWGLRWTDLIIAPQMKHPLIASLGMRIDSILHSINTKTLVLTGLGDASAAATVPTPTIHGISLSAHLRFLQAHVDSRTPLHLSSLVPEGPPFPRDVLLRLVHQAFIPVTTRENTDPAAAFAILFHVVSPWTESAVL